MRERWGYLWVNIQVMNSILLFVLLSLSVYQDKPVDKDCKCKGFPLYGKIKIVNDFPDIKIKFVENFPGQEN